MATLNPRAVRGACPDLLHPMQSGDGWLVRIKPPIGGLTPVGLTALAHGARRYGNGLIEATARGNLQLRGFSSASTASFADEMIDLGLAAAEPAVERIRNILVAPLAGDDPQAAPDCLAVARALEEAVNEAPDLRSLPAKFGFAVDAGGLLPLHETAADVQLWPVQGAWAVRGAGCRRALHGTAQDAVAVALRLARACVALFRHQGERRLRHIAERDEAALWTAADLRPTADASPVVSSAGQSLGSLGYGNGRGTFGLLAPFGAMDADMLVGLADLMQRIGSLSLTIGPWRSLHLRGVPDHQVAAVSAFASDRGFVKDAHDPRQRVTACAGAPACAAATVPARHDAVVLAAVLSIHGGRVHVSGCTKGCASSTPADVTFVGHGGRYALIEAGSTVDAPVVTGLDVTAAVDYLKRHHA
ncbi:precorrin-3B synthase [Reyranella sp. CPCC 100927]|uniref:precorrin-3B synthase n=1 Tax=Reyranella sp. CPCC 100927 TaxID=2599616 RepID=UPI0011B7DCDC|nr:precorrin-3B synthase [Reyranella sp. CPCC 100927]TWT10904.1 precorrin-3B synthase [Reyranella sp. CPCC 100927]